MKQAKIQLTADTRGFKKQIDDAKAMLKTMGDGGISTAAADKLKKIYGTQLQQTLKGLDKEIKNTQKTLETMSNASAKTFDAAKITTFTTKLDQLKNKYSEVKKIQDQIATGKMPDVPSEGGGGKSRGMLGGAGRLVSGLAGGLGIMSLVNRREQMADQRLRIRSLTTTGESVGETSALGFSPAERRERAASLAGATPVGGKELTSLTDMGEQMERAYGIQGDTFAGGIGAARKAGIGNQGKFAADVASRARGAGLEGPQIGEYFQAMTGYLAEMSKGINIDGESLNGFASAMSTLPFFKNDPTRAFDAIRSMNNAFTGGDEFQKAQGIRAIGMGSPGASAAAMEFRREMGLFGKLDKDTMADLKGAGVDTKTLGMGGGEIVKNIFDDIMKSTEGRSPDEQLYEFKSRTGLDTGAAASIFGKIKSGVGMDELDKQVQEAAKTPEDRLNDTFNNADGTMKSLTAMLSRVADGMATNVADPIAKLGMKIDEWIKAMGGDTEGIASAVGTGAVGVAAGVGAYGAAKTVGDMMGGGKGGKGAAGKAGKAGKGAAKGGGKAAKAMKGMKGMAKGGLKAGGKALGRAMPFVGVGMAMKDAYDIYEKWQSGEEITPKDWAVLTASGLAGAAGMVPGIGTGASLAISAAAAGTELLPDDIGMGSSGASGTTPSGGMPSSTNGGVPSPVGGMGGAPGSESDFALIDNTNALRDLTGSLRQGPQKTGIQDRYPSGAQFAGQNVKAGK